MSVMKFELKYSNMTPIDDEIDGIICGHHEEPCAMCGEPTRFIEICAEAHFCSDECMKQFYDEFEQALARERCVAKCTEMEFDSHGPCVEAPDGYCHTFYFEHGCCPVGNIPIWEPYDSRNERF